MKATKDWPIYRYDYHGPWRLMAMAEGYVLARRPGAVAKAMTVKEWNELDDVSAETGDRDDGTRATGEPAE